MGAMPVFHFRRDNSRRCNSILLYCGVRDCVSGLQREIGPYVLGLETLFSLSSLVWRLGGCGRKLSRCGFNGFLCYNSSGQI